MRLLSFGCGLAFALGVGLAGMTRPSKVLGFLDLAGRWDPSLLVVMATALALFALAWRIARAWSRPLLGGTFPGPAPRALDGRLVIGAALFGVGWGLAGFCPGPALVSLATGLRAPLVFVAAMTVGIVAVQLVDRRRVATAEETPAAAGAAPGAGDAAAPAPAEAPPS